MKHLILLFLFVFSFAVEVRILNIEPNSTVKVENKIIKVKDNKLVLNLKEGTYNFVISHPDFLPLKFEYEVERDRPNVIILNMKNNSYKVQEVKNFYKTIKVTYKVRDGFRLVKKKDFCKKVKCTVTLRKNFISIFSSKELKPYKYSNLYKISNKDGYNYFKASVSSDYFYSTSQGSSALKDEKIEFFPVSNWSMLSLTYGLGMYNKADKKYKGIVVDATYRKNLPIDIFVSIKSRFLSFFDGDTNRSLTGVEVGGGIGYLFSNGIMIEGGVLKNYLHAYDVKDKDIVPYGEISYKHLQIHYSPTTTEINFINIDPLHLNYQLKIGYASATDDVSKYTNADGLFLGFKIQSSGRLYSAFQYHYIDLQKDTTNSSYEIYPKKDSLRGNSYGVGIGFNFFSSRVGNWFAEGGIMKYNLKYHFVSDDESFEVNENINKTNPYYEIGVYSKIDNFAFGLSFIFATYYTTLGFTIGF